MSPTKQKKTSSSAGTGTRSASKSTTRTTARAVPGPRRPTKHERTEATKGREGGEPEERERHGLTLPVLHATIPTPSFPMPAMPRPHLGLPSASGVPGRVLWIGGLGTLAVLGAIDWPVALVVAGGTWVAEQRARERIRREMQDEEAHVDPSTSRGGHRTAENDGPVDVL